MASTSPEWLLFAKKLTSVSEQSLVDCNVWKGSGECLVIHGDADAVAFLKSLLLPLLEDEANKARLIECLENAMSSAEDIVNSLPKILDEAGQLTFGFSFEAADYAREDFAYSNPQGQIKRLADAYSIFFGE